MRSRARIRPQVSESRSWGRAILGQPGLTVLCLRSFLPPEGSEYLFRILPNGSIILNGSLNYNSKSSFYQLELKACGGGAAGGGGMGTEPRVTETRLPAGLRRPVQSSVFQCSSSVFVSISMSDKPDLDPQFVREFTQLLWLRMHPRYAGHLGEGLGELEVGTRPGSDCTPCREPRC